jgi:hypothetical protein
MKIFWSWQSDTPETTGRYFVRDALIEAVAQLKIPEDIEEPTTAANREAIHADFDREGVTGSPPLAATIKRKIKEAAVFIADITPVSRVPARKDIEEKRNMNVNVAIELGYPLRIRSCRSHNNFSGDFFLLFSRLFFFLAGMFFCFWGKRGKRSPHHVLRFAAPWRRLPGSSREAHSMPRARVYARSKGIPACRVQ